MMREGLLSLEYGKSSKTSKNKLYMVEREVHMPFSAISAALSKKNVIDINWAKLTTCLEEAGLLLEGPDLEWVVSADIFDALSS